MEAAQCSAKETQHNKDKKFLDESGNFLIVFAIIALIGGAIGYFMTLSGNIDTEVRSLGATQRTVFLKSDLHETIRKTFMQTNSPDCPVSTMQMFRDKFLNFEATIDEAKYNYQYTYDKVANNKIINEPLIKCFFHPQRYLGIEFTRVNIDFVRASEPNLITLSSFVTAAVTIGYTSAGKASVLKYSLRYRVDVLGLNHFGLISTATGKIFQMPDNAKVRVESWTLIDQQTRTNKLLLTNFINYPDTTLLRYNKNFWMAAPGFLTDTSSMDFLTNKKIEDVFANGVTFSALPTDPGFKAPYEMNSGEWREIFNYDMILKYYLLPKKSGVTTAVYSPAMTQIINSYNYYEDFTTPYQETDHNKTEQIYFNLHGNKNQLFKSCDEANSNGQVNLLIFNNLDEDFIIDFSGNTTDTAPPVFCGLIAAKSITVILNDQDTDPMKMNHLIGKFIVRDTIKVLKKGELHIHDIMDVTNDRITYGINDLSSVKLQYYNLKYFSSQNFQVPFFKNQSAYSNGLDSPIGHYIPRSTVHFFDAPCPPSDKPPTPGFICRRPEIDVPTAKALFDDPTLRYSLLYEVFVVE